MPKRFLSDKAVDALETAIKSCEARSAAELVVAVRARTHSYLHSDLIVAMLAALSTTAVLLYSDWSFALWAFLVDPLLAGLVAGFVAAHVAPLRRLLTPAKIRRAWVQRGAWATFYDKGVSRTTGRTGVLVYIALTERQAEVVPDTGVVDAVDPEAWAAAVARVDRITALGGDGAAIAAEIENLGELLEVALPRAHDDVNELPDEVAGQ